MRSIRGTERSSAVPPCSGSTFHPRRLADVLAPDLPAPDAGFWDRLSGVFARESDGHVRFKRPALQEAAYASLPFKLRRELHQAVGLRLEQDQGREPDADPAVLSHHFSLAGDHARAHGYAMAAAKRATERFSHADAARLYRRAIEAGRADRAVADPTALAAAWEELGEALRAIGEPAEAMRALTEARRFLRDDPIAQARLFDRQAKVAEYSGALSSAVRWLKRGFRAIEAVTDSEATVWRARMRSNLAGVRNRQGRFPEAVAACRQAIAEAEAVGEVRALAHACYALDLALVQLDRVEEATHSWRALEIYEQLGDPEHEHIVLNNLGGLAYLDDRWDDAITLYRRARVCGEQAGMAALVAFVDCNVGEILSDQGHLDEAEAHLIRARRVWSATGDRYSAYGALLLGRLTVRRGNYADGLPMLEQAAAELGQSGLDFYADFCQALIAEAEAFGGDPFRALEVASGALKTNDQVRPLLTRVAGIAVARLEQEVAAIRELKHALKTARDRSAAYDIAATIDAIDALGQADSEMLGERDAILARLKIVSLPAPLRGEPTV